MNTTTSCLARAYSVNRPMTKDASLSAWLAHLKNVGSAGIQKAKRVGTALRFMAGKEGPKINTTQGTVVEVAAANPQQRRRAAMLAGAVGAPALLGAGAGTGIALRDLLSPGTVPPAVVSPAAVPPAEKKSEPSWMDQAGDWTKRQAEGVGEFVQKNPVPLLVTGGLGLSALALWHLLGRQKQEKKKFDYGDAVAAWD